MANHVPQPFTVAVPDAVLDLIRRRLELSSEKRYAPMDDRDWTYGTDAGWLSDLRRHWLESYDWRAAELHLNRLPHFKATVDGMDIHFIHLRGNGTGLPLVLTHGWPGSFFEFDRVVEPLAALGFDVVVPSLPGFGFSGRPDGIVGPRRVASLWRRLMVDVLGYARFGAQGGDWGSAVTTWLGRDHADVVAGIHLNLFMGPVTPTAADDAETLAWRQRLMAVQQMQSAYMMEQATKPQTIGLALADNPLGFAAWIMEKFHGWGDTKGDVDRRFGKDALLTNAMTYLVNDTVQSAIWMYRSIFTEARSDDRISVPTGCALFPAEFLPYPPRGVAERVYNIVRWTEMPAGGHFAAMEEPAAFTREVAEFFLGL